MNTRRVLQSDRDGPRFRIVRLYRVDAVTKAEVIGSADAPWEAMQRAFAEIGHVLAVDRRGEVYVDNHQLTQERPL